MLIRLLLVAEDRVEARRLRGLLGDGVAVEEAVGSAGMWEALSRDSFDLLVLGRDAVPEATAELVSTLRRLPDGPDIIALQSDEDPVERARLLTAGCLAVLNRRLEDRMLADTFAALISRRREARRWTAVSEQAGEPRLEDFSSRSAEMRRLLEVAARVARSDASLLVLGETGVGKEWLARAVHGASGRTDGPFVAVNCAAVPESLLESELFGHEKGAFTGAARAHRGHFEMAHRGTLFLDEIADMPAHLQTKLLRVLQERRIQRLGAERPLEIDVRVIAATNRDLAAARADRSFREDLYYRLSVVTLEVPPLRRRREDVAPLVHGYLERFSLQLGRVGLQLRQDTLEALEAYDWPGNVRELINVMERAVLLCPGAVVSPADLPEAITRCATPAATEGEPPDALPMAIPKDWLELDLAGFRRRGLDTAEPFYLRGLLEQCGGRVGRTAERAGIDPRSLYARMRRHGLRKESFRRREPGR